MESFNFFEFKKYFTYIGRKVRSTLKKSIFGVIQKVRSLRRGRGVIEKPTNTKWGKGVLACVDVRFF